MKKIIITGANGFVGSFLARKLREHHFDVTCLVRKGSDISLLSKDDNIVFINYNNDEQIKNVFRNHEILIHLAAKTKAKKWSEFQIANIFLTNKLIDIFNSENSFEQFIFISSQAAAGPSKGDKPKTEDDFCNPLSMYGKSKLEAEKLVQKKTKKNWTIIRPSSVYGPGDKDFLQYFRLISKHISPLIGFKKRYVSLIYVEELINFIIASVGIQKAFGEIFFASDGEIYRWEDFVENLRRAAGTFAITIRIPEFLLMPFATISEIISWKNYPTFSREKAREMLQESWLISNQKAKKILNFNPKPNLERNLKQTYLWYKNKRWI